MPDNGPRNVFVYLVTFLTLYLSAIGMATLTWGLADYWFEDPLDRFGYRASGGSIRTGIAMVVVAYPVFVYLNLSRRKRLAAGGLAESPAIKRVLSYVTLFVIALTAIIDLIAIIFQFLGGELTARFATKGFSILLIVGFVFLYYLYELREPDSAEEPEPAAEGEVDAAPGDGGAPSAGGES